MNDKLKTLIDIDKAAENLSLIKFIGSVVGINQFALTARSSSNY